MFHQFYQTLLLLLQVHLILCDQSDVGLTPPEMIEKHGYVSESHEIVTEDGYILTYHRIPNSNSTSKKPAVLLVHGITGSSGDYVVMGPGHSLGYILADAGYDVWIANTRGNAFARNHTSLDPDKDAEKFYDYSFHEIGYYDLAAAIDYILELNGDDSLYFIAHSQGTTAFLVLLSTRPEYNAKIKEGSLMAAAAIIKNYPNVLVQEVCKYIDVVESILKRYKIYEIPFVEGIREWVSTNCPDTSANVLCQIIYDLRFGGGQVDEEFLPVLFSNNPSNTGLKQFIHFGQQVRDGLFRYFDYGTDKNLEVYGTESPPEYDLSKITAPTAIYYAKNDGLIVAEDEQTLIGQIPNVVEDYLVPYETFKHPDFLYGRDAVKLIYDELLNVMEKY